MDKLKLELENCYGIQKLNTTFDYSNNNVTVIYAPNGTMKSSLAKTFKAIRDSKPVEEKVFGLESKCNITDETGMQISGDSIIVINPFEENAFENQGLLMANNELRKKYLLIHKSIDDKKNSLYEQVKKKLKYSSRSGFDVRAMMLKDWNFLPKDEYECLEEILNLLHDSSMQCALKEDELDYNA